MRTSTRRMPSSSRFSISISSVTAVGGGGMRSQNVNEPAAQANVSKMTSDTWTLRNDASSASVIWLGHDQQPAQPRAAGRLVLERLVDHVLAHPPVAHEQRAQAEVVAGGGGEDGVARAQVELRLLVGPLHGEHAAALALVEERQQVGHLEAREIALERFFHGSERV